jgi:hypothetical protein
VLVMKPSCIGSDILLGITIVTKFVEAACPVSRQN